MGGLTAQQAVSLYDGGNPFVSARALRFSNYSAVLDGVLVRLLDWRRPAPHATMADKALRSFLSSDGFSCVAGKAAVQCGGYRFGYYRGFPLNEGTEGLARDLAAFSLESMFMRTPYATFVAVFEAGDCRDERWFEKALWEQLQRLHRLDELHYGYAAGVSMDPADKDFAFSFAGRAYFVVGMHPAASRESRRFLLPALAFNAHDQFSRARESGLFERIQALVRERELHLQGSLNPELRPYGTLSEARQYSGRRIEEEWQCPFHPHS